MFIPSPFVFVRSFFSFSFPIKGQLRRRIIPIRRLVLETLDMVGGEDRAVADWKILICLDLTVTLHLVVFICLLLVAVELGIFSLGIALYSLLHLPFFHHH